VAEGGVDLAVSGLEFLVRGCACPSCPGSRATMPATANAKLETVRRKILSQNCLFSNVIQSDGRSNMLC
jgi:hypothetical protein